MSTSGYVYLIGKDGQVGERTAMNLGTSPSSDGWKMSTRYGPGKTESRPFFVDWQGNGKTKLANFEHGSTRVTAKQFGSELDFSYQTELRLFVEVAKNPAYLKDPAKYYNEYTNSLRADGSRGEPPIRFKPIDLGTHDPFRIGSEFNPHHFHVSFATCLADIDGDERIDLLFVPVGQIDASLMFSQKDRYAGLNDEQNAKLEDAQNLKSHLYVMSNIAKQGPPKFDKPRKLIANVPATSIEVADLDSDGNIEIILVRSIKKLGASISIYSTTTAAATFEIAGVKSGTP